jgi:hypothetical protein
MRVGLRRGGTDIGASGTAAKTHLDLFHEHDRARLSRAVCHLAPCSGAPAALVAMRSSLVFLSDGCLST